MNKLYVPCVAVDASPSFDTWADEAAKAKPARVRSRDRFVWVGSGYKKAPRTCTLFHDSRKAERRARGRDAL